MWPRGYITMKRKVVEENKEGVELKNRKPF